ncbi:hypothetical protein BD310DRAFT_927891 [Dichomitus squalens]|uniref:Uncharacterized protein n=1 Tax=Dichomitus squalens TaxID=114155 RepID=A0A4Q9PU57_9APHY|nr:hypothetical protein BD310DRAFT_927891 [Dichomitus squalens]
MDAASPRRRGDSRRAWRPGASRGPWVGPCLDIALLLARRCLRGHHRHARRRDRRGRTAGPSTRGARPCWRRLTWSTLQCIRFERP